MPPTSPLTVDAVAIWRAAVAAVDSQRLVELAVRRDGDRLFVGDDDVLLSKTRRILVVGGGKAGAGMAAGVEAALGENVVSAKVDGWVNVPADCLRPLQKIHLHPARPAGINEPTCEGVYGAEQILQRLATLGSDDVCLVLISGGGSALLPAPIDGISLEDKLAVTRRLAAAGATIQELNAVRTRLSRIKGGGLLRAIPAGRVFVLIISDVIGDPLDVIASGPTVPFRGAIDPLEVLQKYVPRRADLPESVWSAVESARTAVLPPRVAARHLVIGNNRTALNAAAQKAAELGYHVCDLGSDQGGMARDVGTAMAEACLQERRRAAEPVCLLSGGEPVVRLTVTDQPRKGGRNQELVLAAAVRLWDEDLSRLAILSGGTDGEDGPTDAAGAWFDADVRRQAVACGLDPRKYLEINNAYPFFAEAGGLLVTGPTHTNVMDVRVGLIEPGNGGQRE
jgi:hydroxypyruvate reductase